MYKPYFYSESCAIETGKIPFSIPSNIVPPEAIQDPVQSFPPVQTGIPPQNLRVPSTSEATVNSSYYNTPTSGQSIPHGHMIPHQMYMPHGGDVRQSPQLELQYSPELTCSMIPQMSHSTGRTAISVASLTESENNMKHKKGKRKAESERRVPRKTKAARNVLQQIRPPPFPALSHPSKEYKSLTSNTEIQNDAAKNRDQILRYIRRINLRDENILRVVPAWRAEDAERQASNTSKLQLLLDNAEIATKNSQELILRNAREPNIVIPVEAESIIRLTALAQVSITFLICFRGLSVTNVQLQNFIRYRLLLSFDSSSQSADMYIANADPNSVAISQAVAFAIQSDSKEEISKFLSTTIPAKKANKRQSQSVLSVIARGQSRVFDILQREIVAAFFLNFLRTALCARARML
eukprot:IDg4397t1